MQGYGTEASQPAHSAFSPVVVVKNEKKPLLSESPKSSSEAESSKFENWQRTFSEKITRRLSFWKNKLISLFVNPFFYLAIVLVIILATVSWYFGNVIFRETTAAKSWFLENSPFSIIWYYTVFGFGTAVLLPYGPFCLAVGYIFGVGQGCLIQLGAIFVSSAICFALGRYIFKSAVEKWLSAHRIWMTMLKLISRDWKEAGKVNLLMCFMPIPYGAHIFLFAISEVPFEQFIAFALIGMMPYTFLELLAGHALSDAEQAKATHVFRNIGTATALVALLLAVCYAAELAQEVLEEAQATSSVPGDHDTPS